MSTPSPQEWRFIDTATTGLNMDESARLLGGRSTSRRSQYQQPPIHSQPPFPPAAVIAVSMWPASQTSHTFELTDEQPLYNFLAMVVPPKGGTTLQIMDLGAPIALARSPAPSTDDRAPKGLNALPDQVDHRRLARLTHPHMVLRPLSMLLPMCVLSCSFLSYIVVVVVIISVGASRPRLRLRIGFCFCIVAILTIRIHTFIVIACAIVIVVRLRVSGFNATNGCEVAAASWIERRVTITASTDVDHSPTPSMANHTMDAIASDALPQGLSEEDLDLQTTQRHGPRGRTEARSRRGRCRR
ncbi:hypothetical protein BJ912DRAFT_1000750, partial [Pholiota molesta]